MFRGRPMKKESSTGQIQNTNPVFSFLYWCILYLHAIIVTVLLCCHDFIYIFHTLINNRFPSIEKDMLPGWCSSVDWAPACEPKGHRFNSQSGQVPGLQAGSPFVSVQEAATHWCFSPTLSPSLALSLKIKNTHKKCLKNKRKRYM